MSLCLRGTIGWVGREKLGLGTVIRKRANDGRNMKQLKLNKYPLVYAPNPSRSSQPPKSTPHMRRSRPLGTSGRDLLSPGSIPPPKWSRPLPPRAETTALHPQSPRAMVTRNRRDRERSLPVEK